MHDALMILHRIEFLDLFEDRGHFRSEFTNPRPADPRILAAIPRRKIKEVPMSEQANTKLVQDMYAAFGRGDVPGLLNGIADDCVWETVGPAGKSPFFGVWRGRDGVGKFFQAVST